MDPKQMLTARITELRAQNKTLFDQQGKILDDAALAKRGILPTEQAEYDSLGEQRKALESQIAPFEARIAEIDEQEKREAAAAASRTTTGIPEQRGGGAQVTDPPIYVRGGGNGNSFFRDLFKARFDEDPTHARDNLRRHNLAQQAEQRALGNTGAVGGSGGEFAPPAWLVEDYVKLARAGRVTADLYKHSTIPMNVSSINLPKINTGTTVALQTTQNTALSQTDLTTTSVSSGIATVGGKQLVAQQLLDQAGIDMDAVITSDLAAAYAQTLGGLIYTGTGTGTGTASVVNGLLNATVPAANQITFTSASPTAALLYSKCAGALSAFATSRYAQPNLWVMHPRRWYWLVAQLDTQNRPLVVPNGASFNQMAVTDTQAEVAGWTGTFLGLPVYIDPNVPTNLGASTNQDRIYLLKNDDLWLFESSPRADVFTQTYADSVGVLFRLYSYVATILNRFPASIAYVDGTGLVAPSF